MPYIHPNRRWIEAEHISHTSEAGELNFLITKLIIRFLGERKTYARFNEAIGVLECAKLELYRRMVSPYEDKKRAEHGDVYPEE